MPSNIESLVECNFEWLCSNVNSLDVNTSAVNVSSFATLDCPSGASENHIQHANDEVVEESETSDDCPANSLIIMEIVDFEHETMEEHNGTEDDSVCDVAEFEDDHASTTELSRSS